MVQNEDFPKVDSLPKSTKHATNEGSKKRKLKELKQIERPARMVKVNPIFRYVLSVLNVLNSVYPKRIKMHWFYSNIDRN